MAKKKQGAQAGQALAEECLLALVDDVDLWRWRSTRLDRVIASQAAAWPTLDSAARLRVLGLWEKLAWRGHAASIGALTDHVRDAAALRGLLGDEAALQLLRALTALVPPPEARGVAGDLCRAARRAAKFTLAAMLFHAAGQIAARQAVQLLLDGYADFEGHRLARPAAIMLVVCATQLGTRLDADTRQRIAALLHREAVNDPPILMFLEILEERDTRTARKLRTLAITDNRLREMAMGQG